ncbi:hypothetical protein RAB80_016970 [Fusarium oxysporum f. sp. vasinfectum]|uniref:Uncharacterized protein n=1 Tax=Fusarium oxysporum f. sp. vasinfectum 25433 TaxID=1089449 RepID=X0M1E8_FUSOX|nr:hypothetical protein FOTG_17093 [Fusarium oxysporum f. sp. vasinfectum 25433]KAK2667779.1 hypothetical protein RAB80_016970 [Fusarium oxysporum f. sp. vasinfectum]KAK2922916.1 hypothetical protein FoTM2_017158 [Fusarium oxysporum f. sp. vasinfectum]
MGCGMSKEGMDPEQTFPPDEQNQNVTAHKKVPTQDGLDAKAHAPREGPPSNNNRNFKLEVFDEAPPSYGECPGTLPSGEFSNFPFGVIVILKLLKAAAELTYWGHKGAWAALRDRHGQIWLDSAYRLSPVTQRAILLYAAIRLLVGKALDSNMTFYFTTFPNLETEQLSDSEIKTLKALMDVFSANTFLQACQLIRQHGTALATQGLEEFVNNKDSFLETDTQDEKLVKLLALTRDKMKGLWHGWRIRDLTFEKLQTLYKEARKETRKQPMLLNNTSFIYQMAVDSYKRQLESKSIYPLTCTFILGTQLEPVEVEVIQQCQLLGRDAVREVRKTKGSLFRRSTQPVPASAAEHGGSVAKELELEGHQFCIQAIVFCDQLNEQSKRAYQNVDDFLEGEPDDINDVTFVSEVMFLLYFLSAVWIFKTTTSHDPRVDGWAELRKTAKYNEQHIVDNDKVIWLPSHRLIRWFVFGIVDDDEEDEAQFSNNETRDPRPDEIALANCVKLGTVPDVGS